MALGRYGIWSIELRAQPNADNGEVIEAVQELEELGYGALWIGGNSDISHAAPLVEATSSIVLATGILSIWEHDPADVAARHTALTAAHPGRFLLGLGASHAKLAAAYERPYSKMVSYLDALDEAEPPVPVNERVLAALGPKMLKLAADRAVGAHPYLVTAEHTAEARSTLGESALLAPELKVVLEPDPERARAIARDYLAHYLALPNYTNNFLRLGFTEDDFANGGSDRLVDAVVAWGDAERVRARTDEFLAAGADHLALQLVEPSDAKGLPREGYRRLAEVLRLKG
ncbi:LLM class F420-dependent oxidoreductase [Streptomyces silvisoli]|uniref:LLM class F420-dependent oxidoreductase n=1 Tax=Streptomyces silvisoli TaxID=3034235 RepID=A0ABT5ZP98_9ACTN|nr:LLM class F420-dependent oxidoreductase [Streptomyces silvisoli]MDF3290828.1 LLM class F420-dependent oxidoreductase [Streptomyces silvisoli]